MSSVTITEILDDLRAADEITRRYERRYWLSSADFYGLYSQGLLDDGEHTDDFALWAGFYEIKQDREKRRAQAYPKKKRLEPGSVMYFELNLSSRPAHGIPNTVAQGAFIVKVPSARPLEFRSLLS